MEDYILEIKSQNGETKEFLQCVFVLISKFSNSNFLFNVNNSKIDLRILKIEDLYNLDVLLDCFTLELKIDYKDLNELSLVRSRISKLLKSKE